MEAKQNVKEVRAKLGLSPTDFAARLGVSRMTVWRIENGDPISRRTQLAIKALLTEHEEGHRD